MLTFLGMLYSSEDPQGQSGIDHKMFLLMEEFFIAEQVSGGPGHLPCCWSSYIEAMAFMEEPW